MPVLEPSDLTIDIGPGVALNADLVYPEATPKGMVVFAHGSGSSRHSPRNKHVASRLREHSLITLLLDLLTADEDRLDTMTGEYRFDIDLLATRVGSVLRWRRERPQTSSVPVGLFGASTGAAAALIAASRRPGDVAAVVSRGGRPDLAGASLDGVEAPTLLIVGELDDTVVDLNREAQSRLGKVSSLEIVPGATHLFEEPGTLDLVADLAGDWFATHLQGG